MQQDLSSVPGRLADELLICEFAVWFLTPRAASPQTCIIPTCTIMDL